jgi:hypothetical protein
VHRAGRIFTSRLPQNPLARHTSYGRLEGLRSESSLDAEAVERLLDSFCADMRGLFKAALGKLRAATGSRSALEANRKFEGFEGSFATLQEFHAGAEASLKLGYPNPDTMKGIRLEHTQHPSVTRLFVTPNYRIATCLLFEYWWAVDPHAPPKAVLDLLASQQRARGLSLVRGAGGAVDIDSDTVTFRCSPEVPRIPMAVARNVRMTCARA